MLRSRRFSSACHPHHLSVFSATISTSKILLRYRCVANGQWYKHVCLRCVLFGRCYQLGWRMCSTRSTRYIHYACTLYRLDQADGQAIANTFTIWDHDKDSHEVILPVTIILLCSSRFVESKCRYPHFSGVPLCTTVICIVRRGWGHLLIYLVSLFAINLCSFSMLICS